MISEPNISLANVMPASGGFTAQLVSPSSNLASLKVLQCQIISFCKEEKNRAKSQDEIARYDTSFIAIPPGLPSIRRKSKSLSVLGADKVGEGLGFAVEVVRTVGVSVWSKYVSGMASIGR